MSEQDFLKTRLFGKLTASATHEFQNVLAIIKESAGLMEDVLAFTPMENADILEERLGMPLSTIKKQVARGVELVSCLNGFAHTTDHARTKVDLVVLSRRLVHLTRRLGANVGVELLLEEQDKPLYLTVDAMQLQLCMSCAMESLFSVLPARAVISIGFKGIGSPSCVRFSVTHPDQPLPGDLPGHLSETLSWPVLLAAAALIDVRPEANETGVSILF
ncbi:hypothetical protein [Desulfocicer niacini]